MLTICILIYLGLIFASPIMSLVEKLKDVDWKDKFSALWGYIKAYAKKSGRMAVKPILQFFYVVTEGETTTVEKAIIYACIAYVVLPFSLLPRAAYKLLGIMDEAAAVLFIYTKIKEKITPDIESKVESTLDAWFGAEYAIVE